MFYLNVTAHIVTSKEIRVAIWAEIYKILAMVVFSDVAVHAFLRGEILLAHMTCDLILWGFCVHYFNH